MPHDAEPTDGHPDETEIVTADQLATELGVPRATIAARFRRGTIPGRKIGRNHHWTTTRAAINAVRCCPGPTPDDYTTDQIATDRGVSRATVYRWFANGLPGHLHRTPGTPGRGTWTTTRRAFAAWLTEGTRS